MKESCPYEPATVVEVADLISRAETLASRPARTLLGIVGAPGAGKSTLCDALGDALGERVAVVGMDGYHLADDVLVALERRERKGAPDTFDVAGYVSLLRRLRRADEDVTYAPRFDRGIESSIGSAVAVPRSVPLVITEGNYLLHQGEGWENVQPLLDEVWFLDVPAPERMRRLVHRRVSHGDNPEHANDWVTHVDEVNASVVVKGRASADLVVHLAASRT